MPRFSVIRQDFQIVLSGERDDALLLDVKMPCFDGFETARAIRRDTATTAGVPIIFLSGCAEQIYRDQTAAAGGNEYLTKPLDFEELEKTLDKYLPRRAFA